MPSVSLYHRSYGSPELGKPPLIFLHGFLGSCANWHSIARRLESKYWVVVPDLRNHGRSPHAAEIGYQAMASDVSALLDHLHAREAVLIGHSMGAKVAMWLALDQPERVSRLVSVDMAPATYPHRFENVIKAVLAVEATPVESRAEADALMGTFLRNQRLRQYLLQNLVLEQGRWGWRFNREGLLSRLEEVFGFPLPASGREFPGPSLFIYGTASDYVGQAQMPQILRLFPLARMRPIAGAGHWVYSDQTEGFLEALQGFLASSSVGG